jgi:hypothetical protein
MPRSESDHPPSPGAAASPCRQPTGHFTSHNYTATVLATVPPVASRAVVSQAGQAELLLSAHVTAQASEAPFPPASTLSLPKQ